MTDNIKLPPMPETEWKLHMPARLYEAAWTSTESGYTEADMENYAREAVRLNATVPDGMVLVPVEPTLEMLEAGAYKIGVRDCYRAMLSASPAAPQPAQQPLTDEEDALLRQALEALEPFELSTSLAERTAEAIRQNLGVKND